MYATNYLVTSYEGHSHVAYKALEVMLQKEVTESERMFKVQVTESMCKRLKTCASN